MAYAVPRALLARRARGVISTLRAGGLSATVGDDKAARTGVNVQPNNTCMQEKKFLEDMARRRPDVEIEYDTYR